MGVSRKALVKAGAIESHSLVTIDSFLNNAEPSCHINVSNPNPRLLLRWLKPSRFAGGALVSTLARRYFL